MTASSAAAVATFDGRLLRETGFVEPEPATWPDDLSIHEPLPAYGRRQRVRATPSR